MERRYHENTLLSTDTEITIPTYEEINGIINKLKSNRTPGPDNITAELIKNGGCTLKRRTYKLILNIWNCEQIPEEWHEGVICPIFKKGDRKECNNYGPITLLNVVYTIFAVLLYNRINAIVEHQLGEYQMGFRPNRSTIDNIYVIRQIYEKCHEYIIDLHN
jgi:hypothetical protein